MKASSFSHYSVLPLAQVIEHFWPTVTMPSNLSAEQLFAAIAKQPWSMFLDSSTSTHVNARYDILVSRPIATLRAKSGLCTITDTHKNTQKEVKNDALTVLESLINQYFPTEKDAALRASDLPFTTGALGYFAYDLGRELEVIPTLASDDLHMPDMFVGLYNWAIVYDGETQQFWFINRDANAQDVLLPFVNVLTNRSPQLHTVSPFALTSSWQQNLSKQAYETVFNRVQEYLYAGDCYQINLTIRFNASYEGDEYQAYQTLREANRAPFSAFIRGDDFSVLSISPERFIQVSDNHIETKPIKGTLPRGKTAHEDAALAAQLKASSKDRAENVMIVDLLRNDLSRVAAKNSVSVPKLFDIESFPAVHHLVSTVTATLAENKTACDVMRHTFPGGSITGAPKIRAMEIIEELEPNRRSVYCGSIGYMSINGKMDTSITIRTLIAKDNQLYCWAGGGVVVDSTAESEYQELHDKVNKILPVLS